MGDERKHLDDLTPDEIAEEMRLREELRDLAELREQGESVRHVSRMPDGRLRILRHDGELVFVDAEIVDGYLEHRRSSE